MAFPFPAPTTNIYAMTQGGGNLLSPFAPLFPDSGDVFLPIPGQSAMWQDAAKTIPADAHGDPVRVLVSVLGRIELTAPTDAARPVLSNSGDNWYLQFSGTNYLTGPYAQSAFPIMLAAFMTSGTTTAQGAFSLSAGATNDYHAIVSYIGDLPRFWARGGGALASTNFRTAAASPYITLANYASADLDLYTDDQAVSEYAPANPFGTQTALTIGGLASDGRGPFNGRIYGAAIRPTLMTTDARLLLRTLWRDLQGL